MKNAKTAVLSLLLLATGLSSGTAADNDNSVSPHGFLAPQCTFGVDWLTTWDGWDLEFSRNWDRDAADWPYLLENGMTALLPQTGDLMVLDGWAANPYGHVAWVWVSEPDTYWNLGGDLVLVVHTNFRSGTSLGTFGGAEFRASWFYAWPWHDEVYCFDSGTWFPLGSFVRRAL